MHLPSTQKALKFLSLLHPRSPTSENKLAPTSCCTSKCCMLRLRLHPSAVFLGIPLLGSRLCGGAIYWGLASVGERSAGVPQVWRSDLLGSRKCRGAICWGPASVGERSGSTSLQLCHLSKGGLILRGHGSIRGANPTNMG